MGISVDAPRGGIAHKVGDATYPMVLRNAEIERFEDKHQGVFGFFEGIMGQTISATSNEVRDLVALGLVGGGMTDREADLLVSSLGPDWNMQLLGLARALIGVAFMPDSVEGGGDPEDEAGDPPKKTDPAPGA